jgi:hypothetical protein
MIPLREVMTEVIFTWVTDPQKKVMRSWATQRMNDAIPEIYRELIPIETPIDPGYADWVKHNCGIEPHRLARITPQVLDTIPALFVSINPDNPYDGKLVDGNHRYLKAHMLGRTSLKLWVFPTDVAERFEVEIPPELYDKVFYGLHHNFSGII